MKLATLTYVKGLPTPVEELNELGLTQFEMFLNAYCPIFHKAACETANFILSLLPGESFTRHKSRWNTYLQQTYGISKRHANGVISFASGAVDSASLCRANHIKTLEKKLKSAQDWVNKSEKKLADAHKLYGFNTKKTKRSKPWKDSQTGCRMPLSCSLEFKQTNWQNLYFQLHHKKRRIYQLTQQISHLKTAPIRGKIPRNQCFVVGSKDESFGNQACQWNGNTLTFRVPYCLESQFGTHVSTSLGNFDRNINRIPHNGAKTWHFFRKNQKWNAAIQFTPSPVERVSRDVAYGAIGIDLNPGSIGWAYVDKHGNLKAHGQIPLEMGLPRGQQRAQIVRSCLQLVEVATRYACPIVCEDLDFSDKKEQLREKGRKYSRMLSSWSYSQFFQSLESIAANRGIEVLKVNPAYTSLIGLVKYARQYGLASDEAAGIAVARRGMNLSEKMTGSITAYLSVKDGKHVWSLWSQLNNLVKKSRVKRHTFYSISNWESQVKHFVSLAALETD